MTTDKAALAAHLAIDKGLNAQQVDLVVLLVVGTYSTYMDKGLNARLVVSRISYPRNCCYFIISAPVVERKRNDWPLAVSKI